jgi:hypothetical protein
VKLKRNFGVSIATASYVMNGKAEGLGITLATRER